MTVKIDYARTLPHLPPLGIETISHLDMYRLLVAARTGSEMVGFAVGESLIPSGVMKTSDNTNFEVQFAGPYLANTHTVRKITELLAHYPDRLKAYMGRYLWFNSLGEVIFPTFEVKANIVGHTILAMQGLVEVWANSQMLMQAVLWDTEGIPRRFTTTSLPVMLFSTLTLVQQRYVVTHFETLGQGFLRFYAYHAETYEPLTSTGAKQLVNTMTKLKSFTTTGSTEFLRTISKEGWLWPQK